MRIRTTLAITATAIAALGSAAAATAQLPTSLSDREFAALIARFSEPAGYFDTDNLISNESSYLHPITTLRRLGVEGGVYVGVGPDQNFSYIAAIRPRAAVIVDIRRDNLLEHLLFKAIFALSGSRVEYLSLLFGKPAPQAIAEWRARSPDSLIAYVARARTSDAALVRIRARVMAEVRRSGVPLSDRDLETIRRFHTMFIVDGPGLRFTTYGRPPAAGYPDYAQLATARDLDGRQRSFLASEDAFRVVKNLQDRNLVIPVVGDFGGPRAFGEVARWMTANRERLSALYASNVEQYLFRDGSFEAFALNLERLPRNARSVIIRSCFVGCRNAHPNAVAGFNSVQMVQLVDTFAAVRRSGKLASYFDLVSLGIVRPSP